MTNRFSGAQLENLMNEAALTAARKGKSTVGWEEVDGALDRLIVGLERKGGTAILSPKQVEVVAYHEAGHAICGALIPDYDHPLYIVCSQGNASLTPILISVSNLRVLCHERKKSTDGPLYVDDAHPARNLLDFAMNERNLLTDLYMFMMLTNHYFMQLWSIIT
jgi:hypothetical protein